MRSHRDLKYRNDKLHYWVLLSFSHIFHFFIYLLLSTFSQTYLRFLIFGNDSWEGDVGLRWLLEGIYLSIYLFIYLFIHLAARLFGHNILVAVAVVEVVEVAGYLPIVAAEVQKFIERWARQKKNLFSRGFLISDFFGINKFCFSAA